MDKNKGKDKNDKKTAATPPKSALGGRAASVASMPAVVAPIAIPKDVVPTFTTKTTNLAALLEFDRKSVPTATVPLIVSKCTNFLFSSGLSTEGIFRVPGNSVRMQKVENEFNRGAAAACDFKKMQVSVEDAASLLKKFLRDSLEDTLFPNALAADFQGLNLLEGAQRQKQFKVLWEKVPQINRTVMLELLDLLINVAANSGQNLMHIDNLSTVFGGMADIPVTKDFGGKWVLSYLLEDYDSLFMLPVLQSTSSPVIRRKVINHMKSIFTLAAYNDQFVISTDGAGVINVWDIANYNHVKKFSTDIRCYVPQVFITIPEAELHQIWILSPDKIRTWDLAQVVDPSVKKIEDSPSTTINIANTCCATQVGGQVWVGGEKLWVYDAATHDLIFEQDSSAEIIHSIGFAADLIWIWKGRSLSVWDPTNQTVIKEIPIDNIPAPKSARYIAVGPDVWVSTDQGGIVTIDTQSLEIKATVSGHSSTIYHLEQIGDLVWSCSWDTSIGWWTQSPPTLVHKMPNKHTDAISYILPVWKHDLNGWDVWTASWDRSIAVTFVPSSYENSVQKTPDIITSVSSSSSTPLLGIASPLSSPNLAVSPRQMPTLPPPPLPTSPPPGRLTLPQSGPVRPKGPPPGGVALPFVPMAPQLHPPLAPDSGIAANVSTPPPSGTPPTPNGVVPRPKSSPPASTFDLESSLSQVESKLANLAKHNNAELERRLASVSIPLTASEANELKAWIKTANESEVDLQLQAEELRLQIRGALHSQRYALIYDRLKS